MVTRITADNNYATARYIVGTSGQANFTTITAAATAAPANSTIFILPGTYTENIDLTSTGLNKTSLNFVAYDADALTPNVTLVGKISCNIAGTISISGIRLQTNSDFALAVTGSAASIVNLKNCYLNCLSTNTGISFTTSSGSAVINLSNCSGDIGGASATLFSHSSSGSLQIYYSVFSNTGASTTESECSAGGVRILESDFAHPFKTSSTGALNATKTNFIQPGNTTCITLNGSGGSEHTYCYYSSGSASCISVGASGVLKLSFSLISSSNTNAITGAGSITLSSNSFSGTSSLVNTTTQASAPIGFAKTASTGTITSDSLSVYEEGTFTPTLVGASTAGTTTYTLQTGSYLRIGSFVFIQAVISISAATGTGNLLIGGLPFTIKNTSSVYGLGGVGIIGAAGNVFPTGTTSLTMLGLYNTTTANIFATGTAGANGIYQMANTSASYYFNICYRV